LDIINLADKETTIKHESNRPISRLALVYY